MVLSVTFFPIIIETIKEVLSMIRPRKPTENYVCESCGYSSGKWYGYCPHCKKYNEPKLVIIKKEYKKLTSKTPPKRYPKNPHSKLKPVDKSKIFSVFTDNLYRCVITGSEGSGLFGIHIHHIFGGPNKKNSEQYGFLIPLRYDWHDMENYGIHFNKELDLKYKRKCQEYWLEHYGTREEFIKVFGMWW